MNGLLALIIAASSVAVLLPVGEIIRRAWMASRSRKPLAMCVRDEGGRVSRVIVDTTKPRSLMRVAEKPKGKKRYTAAASRKVEHLPPARREA